MERRKYSRQLLAHYLELIGEKAGVNLDWDCHQEIESITDTIFDEIDEVRKSTEALWAALAKEMDR